MSLPPATKDISDHPQPGSVTAPVDKEALEADVNRKIRLYGVVQGLRQGQMPDNNQIDKTLSYLQKASPVDIDKLSPEGRKLIQDSRDIIETARLIVKEKNADELSQNFIWHTRDVSLEGAKKTDTREVPEAGRSKLAEDRRAAVQHLRTILTLISTNSEVRKLISDFTAEALRPDEAALARVDEPAASDEFATKEGRKAGPSEAPVLDVKIPGTDMSVEEGQERAQGAKGSVEQQVDRARQEGTLDVGPETSPEEVEVKKRSLKERLKGVRSDISRSRTTSPNRVPQEQKKRATDHLLPRGQTRSVYPSGEEVILECQKHDDYQDAIKWLLSVAEEYAELGQTAAQKGKESEGSLTSDPALRQAVSELRQLLERFANNQSMDKIFDAEFRQWFKRLHTYIRRVLLEAGYVLEEDCKREFWDEKYRSHFDNLFDSTGNWFKAMAEDPLNKRFGEDWARLTRDLLFDSEGSLKFKPELWSDIRKVIVPTLVEQIGYIPIPRIEYTDDTLDLVVENLTLQGPNLFPNIVTVTAHNYLKFSPYDEISDDHNHEFTFTFAQMQADMRDIAFYFRKKTGFPRVVDSGLADVVLGGSGVTATVQLVSAGKDRSSVFKVERVRVKVSSLKFSIRESKHDLLYKTLKPLATGLIKKQIQKAITGAIRTGMEYVDGQLVAVRDRVEEARTSDEKNRTQMMQDVSDLKSGEKLFRRSKEERKEPSVRTTESRSQFKVVHSKRDSIIDIGHPAGWASRVADREEKVIAGKEWRSETFNIV
ncbi:hypothetical protein BU15DRAFT_89476 [Melanogaster broomeanus]|nr:hypothetical protein BU15DRAFT_89476 [Melanogaster broomeanus]